MFFLIFLALLAGVWGSIAVLSFFPCLWEPRFEKTATDEERQAACFLPVVLRRLIHFTH